MLVVDSMIGQESVNIASKFNEDLGIDGVILNKWWRHRCSNFLIKKVTGKPIKYIGTGEKLNENLKNSSRQNGIKNRNGRCSNINRTSQEQFDAEEAEKARKEIVEK